MTSLGTVSSFGNIKGPDVPDFVSNLTQSYKKFIIFYKKFIVLHNFIIILS